MISKFLGCAVVAAMLAAPGFAFAAAGDPGTTSNSAPTATGSQSPAAQPTAPKQQGAMISKTAPRTGGGAAKPSATNGGANMPEKSNGDGGAGDKAGEGK